ncbi:hypothetical protein [Micromonospora sp. NPDC049274]|uniref:hypothetical protein n=1 Tax=Micromonospora sp. NPDC049274 TaxID=3154829 RepID=UPI0034261BE0
MTPTPVLPENHRAGRPWNGAAPPTAAGPVDQYVHSVDVLTDATRARRVADGLWSGAEDTADA